MESVCEPAFGRKYYLHLQGRKSVEQESCALVSCSAHYFALKVLNIRNYRRENLKFYN
jgi:hypothetical protein